MTRLAALLALFAAPALAQAPAHAPCLEPRPDLAAYLAAFEAEGWTLAQGEARQRALQGPSEQLLLQALHSRTLGNMPPIEDPAAFAAEALATYADRFEGAAVLTRGEAALTVQHVVLGTETFLTCLLAAPDLPEADAIIAADPEVFPGDLLLAIEEPPLPPGARAFRVHGYRYEPDLPLAGAEAVSVHLVFEAAP